MSLKSKAALIFLIIFLLYGITDYALQKFVILPGFTELEYAEAEKDMDRVTGAIKAEVQHLDTLCWDWSAWDDTYEFVVTRSRKYMESNLVLSTFADNRINLIYFLSNNRVVIWGEILDLKSKERIRLNDFERAVLKNRMSFFRGKRVPGQFWTPPFQDCCPQKKAPC